VSLSANTPRNYEHGVRDTNAIPVKAATDIYEGALVGDDASGYARGLVAADPFLGIAFRQAINAAGAAGAVNVRLVERGAIEVDVTGVTGVGDVGETVYGSDDGTLTLTSSGNSSVGKVKRHVSGTKCIVAFEAVTARSI
jgi:hypothetical protein